ncbi:MAG: hypothetical protein GTN62_09885 [Gemmatimonadales bacterium]|nr:hypothetical protein [Gemmatimonadales bacterium]NIN11855.1 hypothetical protein [Gemmatimonadales bacterium]NIN50405.1 hypothetical protein [Gemmatimonadales bacterium]NIP07869.1 hypothetical protein [Gemmatimonadales bacterium]NIS66377.1 hypothetical protein [Gemmatimonadales bacterium]
MRDTSSAGVGFARAPDGGVWGSFATWQETRLGRTSGTQQARPHTSLLFHSAGAIRQR